jgi:hypothetical protein
MPSLALFRIIVATGAVLVAVSLGVAGDPLQKCLMPGTQQPSCGQDRATGPRCAIELTCTDKPVQLGYSDGVCFRATCPGIWGLMHKRIDQASFRRRHFTYRHYTFNGTWALKNQGAIESGTMPLRELFLVLPDDLIELKLRDPDANAAIEITNLGYIKKGSVAELKKWLAYNIYLEKPVFQNGDGTRSESNQGFNGWYPGSPYTYVDMIIRPLNSVSRVLGLPWF